MLSDLVLGVIGGGAMGEAIITGLLGSKLLTENQIRVSNLWTTPGLDALEERGVKFSLNTDDIIDGCNVLIMAVKPDTICSVLTLYKQKICSNGMLVISIAAGVNLETISCALDSHPHIVRVMPNTPCLVQACCASISPSPKATENDCKIALALFNALGKAFVLPEKLIDAVIGISGSSPAYVFMMIEAMTDGAVAEGLPRDVARIMAAQAVYGSAKLVLGLPNNHPGELRNRVESPGGTTIAATNKLEECGFRHAVISAVRSAAAKNKEMEKR